MTNGTKIVRAYYMQKDLVEFRRYNFRIFSFFFHLFDMKSESLTISAQKKAVYLFK